MNRFHLIDLYNVKFSILKVQNLLKGERLRYRKVKRLHVFGKGLKDSKTRVCSCNEICLIKALWTWAFVSSS